MTGNDIQKNLHLCLGQQDIFRAAVRSFRRIALIGAILIIGTATAFSSSEGSSGLRYSVCGRIVDLLQDVTGDDKADQRNLGKSSGKDTEFWDFLFQTRIRHLLRQVGSVPAKSIVRLGVIDKVLDVYLAANKSKNDCEKDGCTLTVYYDNGTYPFFAGHIEIDKRSLTYAYIPKKTHDATTNLGLDLNGWYKIAVVHGQSESLSLIQSSVIIPCPAASRDLPECTNFLGYRPQTASSMHKSFQTVMLGRSAIDRENRLLNCNQFRKRFETR